MPKNVAARPGFLRRRQKFTTRSLIGHPFFFPWEDCFKDLDTPDLYSEHPVQQSADFGQWQDSSGRLIARLPPGVAPGTVGHVDKRGVFTAGPSPSGYITGVATGTTGDGKIVVSSETKLVGTITPLTARSASKVFLSDTHTETTVVYSDGSTYRFVDE